MHLRIFILQAAAGTLTKHIPTPIKRAGNGYCFPLYTGPHATPPRLGCPREHTLVAAACVRQVYRPTAVCYEGPACVPPYSPSNTAPNCLDDKVRLVITGLLAMRREGRQLPRGVAPALREFTAKALTAPLSLARESLELYVGAGAAALGLGRSVFGDEEEAAGLIDLGTRLMAFDWSALPDFNQVCDVRLFAKA